MNFRVPNLSLRQNLQSLQQTARPASAIGLGIKKNDQFAATRMWKDLLRKFSTEVPQQTHKRQLRSHADTFTGKEALDCVDALLPIIFNKNCKSDTASKVLQNFLDSRYIVNVRDEQSRTFQDNATLYRLNQDRIDCFLGCHSPQAERKRPNSVVRTSSMRDNKKTQFSQPATEDSFRPGVFPNNQNKIDSSEWQRVHGRLSISCQDVSSISQNMKVQGHSEEPEKKSAARNNLSGIIMDSFNKASSSIMSLHRSASTTKTETRKRANPKFLDDTVLRESVRESKPSRVNMSHHTESQSHNNAPLRIRVRDTTNTSKSVFSTRTNAVASNNVETFGKHKPYLLTTEVSPDSLPTPTFCNRIDKFTYEKQSRSTNDSHLLPLLEAILSNHKISNAEKFKQLRTFRLSYPSIYAQRFPVDSGWDPLMTEEEQNIEPDRGGDFGVGSSIFSNLMRKIAF